MRVIIVGYGIQGKKRHRVAGEECVGIVDPALTDISICRCDNNITDVPLDHYDAAIVCTPYEPKISILNYLITNGKHVMVEKPLLAEDDELYELERKARKHGVACYTAYNHRFEPHFVCMNDLIKSGELGQIYHCRMFYGNGTARNVRESPWRDKGDGVLLEIAPHLLDAARWWFGSSIGHNFTLVSSVRFENKAPDHAVFMAPFAVPQLEFEVTYLSWKNNFTCDVLAEKGSAHIDGLTKWGQSTFIHRRRVLPSGRPLEQAQTVIQEDQTWQLEYNYFKKLIANRTKTDLSNDHSLNSIFRSLSSATLVSRT